MPEYAVLALFLNMLSPSRNVFGYGTGSIWVSDSLLAVRHGDGGVTDLDGHRQQVQHVTVPLPAVILHVG